MKKILVLLTVFALLMVFSACDNIGDNGVDIIDQTYDITVEVLDGNDEPIADMRVFVNGDKIYYTDSSGMVDIQELEGENIIEIQEDSYPSKTVDSSDDGEVITFRPGTVTGSGLIISGRLSEEPEVQAADTSNDEPVIDKIVLIFRHGYEVIDIENETFAIDFPREPGAITFVDSDGNYVGNLALENGMDSIPGDLIDEDTDEIDLGLITFEDGTAYSEDDEVVFDSLTIQDNDLEAAAVAGSFFSAAAISPDLVEALIDDDLPEIRISNRYYPEGLEFAESDDDLLVESDINEIKMKTHRLAMSFTPGIIDEDVEGEYKEQLDITLNGKDHDIEENEDQIYQHGNTTSVDFLRDGVPEAGEYNVVGSDIDSEFNFFLPDILDEAENNLIIPGTTVELVKDDEGRKLIDRIYWDYYTNDSGNDPLQSPESILSQIEVQIGTHGVEDDLIGDYEGSEFHGDQRIYNSGNLDINSREIDLSNKNIYWRDVSAIAMAYDDIYGIHYVIGF